MKSHKDTNDDSEGEGFQLSDVTRRQYGHTDSIVIASLHTTAYVMYLLRLKLMSPTVQCSVWRQSGVSCT